MDENLLKQAKEFAERNYRLSVFVDKLTNGQAIYMAKNPELNGCMAQGVTIEEAINNLDDARVDYIYDSLENGNPVPEPATFTAQTAFTINSEQIIINKTISFEKTLENVSQSSHSKQIYEAWIGTGT
jgi:predicted RNase H-like HicB family nuclease